MGYLRGLGNILLELGMLGPKAAKQIRPRDDFLITLAGPFSNLCIALLATFLFAALHNIQVLNEAMLKLFFIIILV